jgi:hypothetical protein
MAKQYANKPEDKKIKKKLWMKIAKYLFNYQGKKKSKKNTGSQLFQQNEDNKNGGRGVV